MKEARPTAEMAISDILEEWPETAAVFQQLQTACVGCAMAPFDTVADVARIYRLDLPQFLNTLCQAAAGLQ
jgi:hybrid cluster-associated redox disulfide protein